MKRVIVVVCLVLGLFITNAWAEECNPNQDNRCFVKLENKRCDNQGNCIEAPENTCYKLYHCTIDINTGKYEWKHWSCSPTPGNEPACPSGVEEND